MKEYDTNLSSNTKYSEELNSITSSATYQRTNRQGILGQKPSDFQRFLGQRDAEHSSSCPGHRAFQEQRASSQTGHGTPRRRPRVVVVGHRRRAWVASALGGGDPLCFWPHARCGCRPYQRVLLP